MKITLNVQLVDALRSSFKLAKQGAALCSAVPTIVVLGLVMSVTFAAQASGPDLSLGGTLRSYALSGITEVEAGYGQVVWGDPSTPLYGYIRPRAAGRTALTYNSLDGALEVFPLSFLGMRGGGEAVQNDRKYTPYDCETYRCMGRFYRTYAEAEVSMGAGPVFAQARWRRERWTQPHGQTGDFIDSTSGLAMQSTGDSQIVYVGAVGYKLDANWALIAALRYAENDLRQISRMPFGSLRYRGTNWGVALGAGTFESELKKQGVTVLGQLRWDILPSVALH